VIVTTILIRHEIALTVLHHTLLEFIVGRHDILAAATDGSRPEPLKPVASGSSSSPYFIEDRDVEDDADAREAMNRPGRICLSARSILDHHCTLLEPKYDLSKPEGK
jgi:hypothetical protein